jgi:hypothetical protein
MVDGHTVRVATSLIHGKEMGTMTSLCGQSAVTWTKMWDQPFHTVEGPRCPECVSLAGEPLAPPGPGATVTGPGQAGRRADDQLRHADGAGRTDRTFRADMIWPGS